MKFVLPLAVLLVGIRTCVFPVFEFIKFGVIVDLSEYNLIIGPVLILIGFLLLREAMSSNGSH